MRFRLVNAGPVVEAEADLSRPLTVLVGPNNAGKTWFAWSIYAAMRCPLQASVTVELLRELLDAPGLRLDLQSRWSDLRTQTRAELPAQLRQAVGNCFGVVLDEAQVELKGAPRPAGNPANPADGYLWKTDEMNFRLSINWGRSIQGSADRAEQDLDSEHAATAFRRWLGKELAAHSDGDEGWGAIANTQVYGSLLQQFNADLTEGLVGLQRPTTFVLPTERAAITLFADELARGRFQEGEATSYPWPIRDALAAHFDRFGHRQSPLAPIADGLEARLLGGAIGRARGALTYQPTGSPSPLSMHLSSSMVKSVASIVEFLRWRARPGQILIIDEPELNLHPDNQRLLARALVEAANAGLRLVLSTHSDWFLRELNRLMIASSLPPEHLPRHGLRPEETLSPEKAQVLLFKQGRATPLLFDERGLDLGTIDEETHKLNEDEQRLYMDRDGLLP